MIPPQENGVAANVKQACSRGNNAVANAWSVFDQTVANALPARERSNLEVMVDTEAHASSGNASLCVMLLPKAFQSLRR